MHDLDRTLRELERGMESFGAGDYELEGDYELSGDPELEGDEMEYDPELEMEYGSELESDDELDGEFEADLEGEFEADFDGELEVDLGGEMEGGFDPEYEGGLEGEDDGEAVFDEVEEMELAAALLEVSDERELDHFLSGVLKRAGAAVAQALATPGGRELKALLKRLARKAVPAAGAAIGNVLLPGAGGAAGAQIAATASKVFGLELEGLSPQDQEFELARRFVRLAGAAAQEMASNPGVGSPRDLARTAIVRASRWHAPGLAGRPRRWRGPWGRPGGYYGGLGAYGAGATYTGGSYPGGDSSAGHGGYAGGPGGDLPGFRRSGRWVRRGRRIILYGV